MNRKRGEKERRKLKIGSSKSLDKYEKEMSIKDKQRCKESNKKKGQQGKDRRLKTVPDPTLLD
ncbi:unnamed protein product [Dovyalis caffra]|uniref:Uncharacterized protein n=1 Tax=Dovyalis caffra TaxID=77055 RepID=A0AAV1RKV8_9ROSI|nr:unnamed protein product [Dovyalis caffra]